MTEEQMPFVNRPWVIPASVGAAAFCGGLGLGYFIRANKDKILDRFKSYSLVDSEYFEEPEYEEKPEVPDPRDLYPIPDPNEIEVDESGLDRLNDLVDRYGVGTGHEVFSLERHGYAEEEKPEAPVTNIFAHGSDSWDYDEELKFRTTNSPYVIHKDEFWADEFDYSQSTLTYFSGDDILVDEKDTPIYNYASVIGELKFGHGSQDPNVFYVRNPKNKAEYEILFDSGSYAVEILGLEMEHKNSQPSIDKFRPDD
jgi:hypothetical protein